MKNLHLTAFVADASILPRQSGVSDKPLKESIPFFAPDSLAIELTLPHKGTIRGPFKGLWLAIKRLLRCHPWGGSGYDPVP